LGKGAFGEVYGGSLGDERQVAVKRSKKVNEAQKEQFANEIIVQSRIIHKNIVKLIGCCLEVDVPMLVYEFVSGGTLEDTLHGCKKARLSLDQRLVIAAETSDGLVYMHFKTPTIILHGDVKPSNILLDDNLIPKISDFGISKLIPLDKAQQDGNVIGDIIYMDPVYRETGLLTTKSDVYSFGVVLLELITRKQAKDGNLVQIFVATYTRENAQNLLDKDITEENEIEVLHNIAELAIECLNVNNVDQRPDMTEVAERLQTIRRDKNK
jgi:serine/threonine protein kinase